MSDYMPVEVMIGILKRLPVKYLVSLQDLEQSSLSKPPNNTPFLLLGCFRNDKHNYFLHYDNDGFDKFKQLQFPPISCVYDSCNALICVRFYAHEYDGDDAKFLLWNPSIQRYISLHSQQMGASLYLNCLQIELHGVDVKADLLSVDSYVESLVLLDKAVDVRSESDVNHPIDSSDCDELSGGECDLP